MPHAPGTSVGPYELLAPLGAGGMGEVWRAHDSRLGRTVAIKFLHAAHTGNLEHEARAIAALNHPHICAVYDIGTSPDGSGYLVMEYVEGSPLPAPLPPADALRFAGQIAEALASAHAKGVVHRDLKPGNILVTTAGVKLLDFGLAKLEHPSPSSDDSTATQTIAGTVKGTVAYMSPEQAQGRSIDARSDIFSFGLVLYEMLSGERAFKGETAFDTMASIVRDEPKTVDASPELKDVVERCLRKSLADRFQNMNDVRAALQVAAAKLAASKPGDEQPSIAVLPFANMSVSKDDEYFSDGLAEEILNLLAHIPGLKVTARTSSFAFRGKEQDITGIAGALKVRTILEGSVRRAGNRIRVTAQLIEAADGYHIWSERYDRELTDVFAVQDEIAAAIAQALHVKLAPQPAGAPRHQPSLPAYEACLKGRHMIFKGTPEAFARAKDYLEQAIALDPQYAEPHAELSMYFILLAASNLRPSHEVTLLARAAARNALDLSPSEPRAHAALALAAGMFDYDWKAAEEHVKRAGSAGALAPETRIRCALALLVPRGRFTEAILEIETALAQDPLNGLFRGLLALVCATAGQHERAVAEAHRALEIDERYWFAYYALSLSHTTNGSLPEAKLAAENAVRVSPWNGRCVSLLAGILARLGEQERALDLLAPWKDNPGCMTQYHMLIGAIDAAAESFEAAVDQRDPNVTLHVASVLLKPVRESPRWPAIARKMNLA